jgi:hypothetical protein
MDMCTLGIPPYDHPAWAALERFFCRPWFSRLWVIQERLLSYTLSCFCGHQKLDWIVIEAAATWIVRQCYNERSHRWGLSRASNVGLA